MLVLATLAKGIELPALSRRTGKLCRAVQTRELVLSINSGSVHLAAVLDREGRLHLSALREVRSVQRGLVACARQIAGSSSTARTLRNLPCAIDFGANGSMFDYFSITTDDRLDLEADWADTQGNIVGQVQRICGILVPQGDHAIAPFRQLGHLWSNGQFALSAKSVAVSFIRGLGVVFAAHVPSGISMQAAEHFRRGWGNSWEPDMLDEDTIAYAHSIEKACGIKPRTQLPLDITLITRALKKKEVDLSGWRAGSLSIKFRHHIWRNGVSRDGTRKARIGQ